MRRIRARGMRRTRGGEQTCSQPAACLLEVALAPRPAASSSVGARLLIRHTLFPRVPQSPYLGLHPSNVDKRSSECSSAYTGGLRAH